MESQREGFEMLRNDLLASKFHMPRLRTGQHTELVPRPQVVELLEQGTKRALTLISAPAGSGKTTILSSWLRDSEVIAAWLSLDRHDNDLLRFWTYVVAALDALHPGAFKLAQEALKVGRSRPSSPMEDILTALINDIVALDNDIVLVFDDYHEIVTPAIHASLAFLLDHLPTQLHLFIVSRNDPPFSLARLRTSNQLIEVRTDDLRFSPAEATLFLKNVMGLHLTAEEIAVLTTRTEGWIAGLQLAGLSLQRQRDIAGSIAAFAGTHRYIVNYLAEEVLQKQSEQVQQFLLYTSLLERLSADLCQAVTGNAESRAMLAQLELANLFIVALDDERVWYRYHQLFADFLRTRLQQSKPALVRELHYRAADWYQSNGYYEEAMSHLLTIPDFARAVQLIENSSEELMRYGDFTTLQRWISSLPAASMRNNSHLIIIHATVLAFQGKIQEAERRLQDVEALLNDDRESIEGKVMSVRAFIETYHLNFPLAIEFARKALEILPTNNFFMRSMIVLCLGIAFRFKDSPAAHQALEQAIREAESPHIILLSLEHLGYQLQEEGQLHRAQEIYQQALRLQPEGKMITELWLAYLGLAELQREWNRLEQAEHAMLQALKAAHERGRPTWLLDVTVTQALIKHARGRTDEALALLRQEELLWQREQSALAVLATRAYQALLEARHGNLQAALPWMQDFEQQTTREPLNAKNESFYRILAQIQLAAGRTTAANALLEQLLAFAQTEGRMRAVIKTMALQALVLQASGAIESAISKITQALILAEPEGYVLTFTEEGLEMTRLLKRLLTEQNAGTRISSEYLQALLAASVDEKVSSNTLLSERELEILRLISIGLSNQEIADRLVIAMSTVKWHVRQIFNKLSVNSRTQVLARARELNLL